MAEFRPYGDRLSKYMAVLNGNVPEGETVYFPKPENHMEMYYNFLIDGEWCTDFDALPNPANPLEEELYAQCQAKANAEETP